MRVTLSFFLGLVCLGSLAAQTAVPGDQCLGGWLVAIQPQSITLKFNDKVTTMPIAPGAEIWRRGADLDDIHQLVIGDQIFLKCTRAGDAGPVMASIVAAVEQNDGIRLVPHNIAEVSACIGRLSAVNKDTMSLQNGKGGCVIHTNAQTTFWRGETYRDAGAFQLGDEVTARVTVGYPGRVLTAEHVEANVGKVEGTVISAQADRIVVKDSRSGVQVTVLRDAHMSIVQDTGWPGTGAGVMVTGLELGRDTIRAYRVWVEK